MGLWFIYRTLNYTLHFEGDRYSRQFFYLTRNHEIPDGVFIEMKANSYSFRASNNFCTLEMEDASYLDLLVLNRLYGGKDEVSPRY